MTFNPTAPVANNHPVPLSNGDAEPSAAYPEVPQDGRIISIDDLGIGRPDPLGYVSTGK